MSGAAGTHKKSQNIPGGLFFTMSFSKCIWLIFQRPSLFRKGNVERHFCTVHKRYDTNLSKKRDEKGQG